MLDELDKRVELISDPDIKTFTLKAIHGIPENIWKQPSSWNHHLPDEREEWGNALHSLRVTDVCLMLADSLLIVGISRDYLLSAALLHDIGKRGLKGDTVKVQTRSHPFIVESMLTELNIRVENSNLIFEVIRDHMGRWTYGTAPDFLKTRLVNNSMVLHLADCIVARWAEIVN